jgi:MOSC domain-containing protein YiiM
VTEPPSVVAVCLSEEGGVPKYPQPSVNIGPDGVEGDYHAGPTRKNGAGETVPNHRQVTVVAAEAVEAVGAELAVDIPPGGLGENILVRGLGDLGELVPGQRIIFGSGVELEVTEQNNPCANLSVYHPRTPKELYGRRGVLTIVANPGMLRPGDSVSIVCR